MTRRSGQFEHLRAYPNNPVYSGWLQSPMPHDDQVMRIGTYCNLVFDNAALLQFNCLESMALGKQIIYLEDSLCPDATTSRR